MDHSEDKVDLWAPAVIMMPTRIYIYISISGHVSHENHHVLYMFNDSNLGMIYCVEKNAINTIKLSTGKLRRAKLIF